MSAPLLRKWSQARSADRECSREDVQILQAEFEQTVVSHKCMAEVWAQLADTVSCPGAAAYAHKKAEMYSGLAKECSKAYEVARKEADSADAG
jgi:hypothetical protein